jgi:hypothetical protein
MLTYVKGDEDSNATAARPAIVARRRLPTPADTEKSRVGAENVDQLEVSSDARIMGGLPPIVNHEGQRRAHGAARNSTFPIALTLYVNPRSL